ncbi:type B 50S ribosomal protein L31 [Gordonia neofelifaecis]|uniref:Large ribosomal subunit protein bL31B n=1 Tax=Gordonia neofelifaecis NRRL B-59395 TaxID=644548 RepID=F1YIY4_9ACTN|nr:type B 50S ribosomal protein L31 [Gordonia neofelifaecis]EGD55431.1 50S ribosomal protein L31 type B [Gordonia neofelifaecis NRRL B-59395]
MKPGIHPDYRPLVFRDAATGAAFLTRSTAAAALDPAHPTIEWTDGNTYPLITVDVTSDSHPFWTGTRRLVDTEGRVERFNRRYGREPSS